MPDEARVLGQLLALLEQSLFAVRAQELRGRWVERRLPTEPQEEATGRQQVLIAADLLQELSTEAGALARLASTHRSTGIRFRDMSVQSASDDSETAPGGSETFSSERDERPAAGGAIRFTSAEIDEGIAFAQRLLDAAEVLRQFGRDEIDRLDGDDVDRR